MIFLNVNVTSGALMHRAAALVWAVPGLVNTAFVGRSHGADRHRNGRKARETYRLSKDWGVHEAMTYLTL